MRLIILAAGQGYGLDGFNKLLIKSPSTGKTILDYYIDAFQGMEITVVVGYRAINVMHNYPSLNYVYNPEWRLSNNSYSLSLVLDDRPTYVVSGDLFIKSDFLSRMHQLPENVVFTQANDNRSAEAINVETNSFNQVTEFYQGPVKDVSHNESIGIFKIFDKQILKEWRKRCIANSRLFAAQNLPLGQAEIYSEELSNDDAYEIDLPDDYIRLIERDRLIGHVKK